MSYDPVILESQCFECNSEICAFNPCGVCRYPMVYGRPPEISFEGCSGWLPKKEED